MIELLWLLPVPLIAAWWITRRRRRPPERRQRDYPPELLQGLRYLFDDEIDSAVGVFSELLERYPGSAEIYFLLGREFRRLGQIERAISAHQNLIARPDLDAVERERGLLELARDFQGIGWLDRAERLYRELEDSERFGETALKHLLELHESGKDWNRAIATGRQLERRTGESAGPRIAHYYCELAEAARARGETGEALGLAGRALGTDRGSVRASLLRGRLFMAEGRSSAALKAFRRVERQDAAFMPEIVEPVIACHRQLGQPEGAIRELDHWAEDYPLPSVVAARARLLAERGDADTALVVLEEHLGGRPSADLARTLVEIAPEHCIGPPLRERLAGMLGELAGRDNRYVCRQCGFETHQLYWRCPGCRSWSSIKPGG